VVLLANLLYAELLKLKRSNMFLVSIIGAAVAPFMCFIADVAKRNERPDSPVNFGKFFSDTNFYVLMLIGVMLYGVITAYLFNREYVENTLKNILTIPVSKTSLIVSKVILLFIWIMLLTIAAWALTLVFGLIGSFEDLTIIILIKALKEYLIGGTLLFLLAMPTIFVTLLFKDYVPTIIFTIAITMVNVLISNSKYSGLYPWSATLAIATKTFRPEYAPIYSYISIFAVSIIGFIATIVCFNKEDIR
jgi:bacitracin transport system permease protein